MSTVLGLHELGRDDISSRWQSANLGELMKAGFDVPDGFVVATHAYPAALELRGSHRPQRTRTNRTRDKRPQQRPAGDRRWRLRSRLGIRCGGLLMIIDHRTLPRRRGRALHEAILEAALAELAEVGYANLTMERVAARAKASKASVYSRWPSRIELVMDVFYHLMPDPDAPPDSGSLRGDLLATLRQTAELLAGPAGEALRGLLGDVLPDPTRTAEMRRHSHQHGRRTLEVIAGRAVERGEISAVAVTPLRLEAGPAMLRNHFLFQGLPVPDAVIVGIVDHVIVPLLTDSRPVQLH